MVLTPGTPNSKTKQNKNDFMYSIVKKKIFCIYRWSVLSGYTSHNVDT